MVKAIATGRVEICIKPGEPKRGDTPAVPPAVRVYSAGEPIEEDLDPQEFARMYEQGVVRSDDGRAGYVAQPQSVQPSVSQPIPTTSRLDVRPADPATLGARTPGFSHAVPPEAVVRDSERETPAGDVRNARIPEGERTEVDAPNGGDANADGKLSNDELDGMSKSQLLDVAEDESVDVQPSANKATLVAAIRAKRGG